MATRDQTLFHRSKHLWIHSSLPLVNSGKFRIISQVLTVGKHLQTPGLFFGRQSSLNLTVICFSRPVAGVRGLPVTNFATLLIFTGALSEKKKDTTWVKEPESFLVSREELENTQSQIWLVKNYYTKWLEVVFLAIVAI